MSENIALGYVSFGPPTMPYHITELSARESVAVFRALGSEPRARIMELLAKGGMNINELSLALGIAQPSVSKHIQILEEAGLVLSDYQAGPQGMQKRCRGVHQRILVELEGPTRRDDGIAEIEVPVGMYSQVDPVSTCGLATREKIIGLIDTPLSFYMPERARAEILWSSGGYVEYMFPNTLPQQSGVRSVDLSMEVSSEAPGVADDYPSDLTVWINGVEIGTWCSPGDYGVSRGRLNPHWWPDNVNQHGLLKVWQVDGAGTSVDGIALSSVRVDHLGIKPWEPVRVRIGIKSDAANQGGFTLFGRGFGNYEMDLVLRIVYDPKNGDRTI